MHIVELISKNKPAVVQITISNTNGVRISSGSAFFAMDHLISNNHVFFDDEDNPLNGCNVSIRYLSESGFNQLDYPYDVFMKEIVVGSDVSNKDFIINLCYSRVFHTMFFIIFCGKNCNVRTSFKLKPVSATSIPYSGNIMVIFANCSI